MNNILDGVNVNFHASIKIVKNNIKVYIDPFKIEKELNDADYIFITHNHYDHYSSDDINKVINDNTILIMPESIKDNISGIGNRIIYVKQNENYNLNNISFHTVASYNLSKSYHPKSNNWVGYNILIDNIKYYVLGDTDVTDEAINEVCDVMFVPVGGTYTMDYKEAAKLVNSKNIKYAVPIHYGVVGSYNDAINFINLLEDKSKGVILVK